MHENLVTTIPESDTGKDIKDGEKLHRNEFKKEDVGLQPTELRPTSFRMKEMPSKKNQSMVPTTSEAK